MTTNNKPRQKLIYVNETHVECPSCGKRFKPDNKLVFNGNRHITCGQLLETGKPIPAVWCVVCNFVLDNNKHFSKGTKIYCLPPQWGDGYEKLMVYGLHKQNKKVIQIIMPWSNFNNFRAKLIYSPNIIDKITGDGKWDDSEESKQAVSLLVKILNERL